MASGYERKAAKREGEEGGGGGEAEDESFICGGSVVPKNIHHVLCPVLDSMGILTEEKVASLLAFHSLVHID